MLKSWRTSCCTLCDPRAAQTRALWLGYQLAQGLVELAEVHSYEYLYPSVRYSLRFSQGTNVSCLLPAGSEMAVRPCSSISVMCSATGTITSKAATPASPTLCS